jgi:hypothetical protein
MNNLKVLLTFEISICLGNKLQHNTFISDFNTTF